ncbi:hypothetical protein [Portibacter marinus]|uniref:hypothetical protein n=1 Tax=Portibacter marinus TaxID=2898660 RepID=UPI001F3DEB3D|nr:hypothetical protein [Portibacter marinus]
MEHYEHDLESFNILDMDEQLNIAKHKASKVESIESEEVRIDLYSYCDFFIELVFRKELRIIKAIRGIDAMEYAEKYIELEDLNSY